MLLSVFCSGAGKRVVLFQIISLPVPRWLFFSSQVTKKLVTRALVMLETYRGCFVTRCKQGTLNINVTITTALKILKLKIRRRIDILY